MQLTLHMIQGNSHGVSSFNWIEGVLCVFVVALIAVPVFKAWREMRKEKEQNK